MICKKCNSDNIQVQRVVVTKRKKKGLMYWLFGWMIDLMLWIFLTLPRLILQVILPKKTKTVIHSEAVCQNCGYSWKI